MEKFITKIQSIESNIPLKEQLNFASELIKTGEVVAFPTETVYGLGGDALNPEAIRKIYSIKGRPSDNPLIVHISGEDMLYELVDEDKLSETAKRLIECFFPGPLTIIVEKSGNVPNATTSGLDTIAIRWPANNVANSLIQLSETPIAAPSANTSGKPSPTNAKDVFEDMEGKIKLIIDGGSTEIGFESTVVDVHDSKSGISILRPGKVTPEEIELCLKVPFVLHDLSNSNHTVIRSPGMKYRHYAPKAKIILVSTSQQAIHELERNKSSKKGIFISKNSLNAVLKSRFNMPEHLIFCYSSSKEFGSKFFKKLREMDREGVELIIIQFSDTSSFGNAIFDRLKKAASNL